MKRFLILALAIALVASSCQLLQNAVDSAVSGAVSGAAGGTSSSVTADSATAVVEFQAGDVLCSPDKNAIDGYFSVARVLTPASASTKNQAEVLYVNDGSKQWVNHVINSRKATKGDMTVGQPLFVCPYIGEGYVPTQDEYRKNGWYLGLITSTEYLYKNMVEVAGNLYNIDYTRVPTDPVK
jgi:hypothetical protein